MDELEKSQWMIFQKVYNKWNHLLRLTVVTCTIRMLLPSLYNKLVQHLQSKCVKLYKKQYKAGVGDVAQWYSTCLACSKPWVQSSALGENSYLDLTCTFPYTFHTQFTHRLCPQNSIQVDPFFDVTGYFYKDSGFQLRGHLAMSGDILGCNSLLVVVVRYYWPLVS